MEHYSASTLFQPSNLVQAIHDTYEQRAGGSSGHLYGSIMAFPHHKVARTVATLGFDFVMIDALHTAINPETLVMLIQTVNFVSGGKTCAVVRVPSANSDFLAYALDAGAAGIIFPHIDTPEEAAQAVHKVLYEYSGGERSLSPCALMGGITDLAPEGWTAETIADRNIAVICQIESKLAVENAEAIATTPGVHALMVGSGDLRVSLGLPARTPPGQDEDPVFYRSVDTVIDVSRRHRKGLMIVAFKTNTDRQDWLKDFNMILTSADIVSVAKGHREDLAKMKAVMGEVNGHTNGHTNGSSKKVNGTNGHS